MNKWFKFLRIALGLTIAALFTLGISNGATMLARHDQEFGLINSALLFLFPAVLYSIYLARGDALDPFGEASARPSGMGRSAGFPAVYSLAVCSLFWLGWLVVALVESRSDSDDLKSTASEFLATLVVLIMVHVFVVGHLGPAPQPLSGDESQAYGMRQRTLQIVRGTDRLLRLGGRLLWPPLLLGLGGALVLAAPFAFGMPLRHYQELIAHSWITAEYGLSDHLAVVRPAFDLLGRGMFVGMLVLAVVSLGCILSRVSKTSTRLVSRARSPITWAAGILCLYSILDLYFGWVGFLVGQYAGRVWLWFAFGLAVFYFSILVVIAATAAASRCSKLPGHASFLPVAIASFSPLLCANTLITTPFLTPDFIDLRGMAAIYLGIQFLCWGWVEMAFPRTR
jgi:hypothetical protein